jgi:hypothetical protein
MSVMFSSNKPPPGPARPYRYPGAIGAGAADGEFSRKEPLVAARIAGFGTEHRKTPKIVGICSLLLTSRRPVSAAGAMPQGQKTLAYVDIY